MMEKVIDFLPITKREQVYKKILNEFLLKTEWQNKF